MFILYVCPTRIQYTETLPGTRFLTPIAYTNIIHRHSTGLTSLRHLQVSDVRMVKEYACLQGLVAVDKAAIGDLPKIREAMLKVMQEHKPTYT
jgi:hypothetical protein